MVSALLPRRPMLSDHRGFTLLELLLVIVLIGILSGLAIAQVASYRARGYDSQVSAAVRAVATSEEAYYASHQRYAADLATLGDVAPGGVAVAIAPGNSGNLATSFRIEGSHPNAGVRVTWTSDPAPGEPSFVAAPAS